MLSNLSGTPISLFSRITNRVKSFLGLRTTQFESVDTTQGNLEQFRFPFRKSNLCNQYWYCDKPEFKDFISDNPEAYVVENRIKKWILGDRYDEWVSTYFSREAENYGELGFLAENLQFAIKNNSDVNKIDSGYTLFKKQIQIIKNNIENERPKWRFTLSWWPIVTLGWPFNRTANKFTARLFAELKSISMLFSSAVNEAKERSNAVRIPINDHLEHIPQVTLNNSQNSLVQYAKDILNSNQTVIESAQSTLAMCRKKDAEVDVASYFNAAAAVVERKTAADAALYAEVECLLHEVAMPRIKSLDQERFEFEQLRGFIDDQLDAWQDAESEQGLQLFKSEAEAASILEKLMVYRDKLASDDYSYFIQLCDEIKEELTFYQQYSRRVIDADSKSQLALLVHLLQVITADVKHTEDDGKNIKDAKLREALRKCSMFNVPQEQSVSVSVVPTITCEA